MLWRCYEGVSVVEHKIKGDGDKILWGLIGNGETLFCGFDR